jgi:hypothetical protein
MPTATAMQLSAQDQDLTTGGASARRDDLEPTARTYRAISAALIRILRPIVRLLLRNGVTYQAFAETLKVVYVEVAAEEFRIPGRKQSDSRIAVITGLSRKEVKRVAAAEPAADAASYVRFNRAARVIEGWNADREFSDAQGPKHLALEGGPHSFAELVRRYSGDAPPRAVLDELERVGAVARRDDGRLGLLVRRYQPRTDDADRIAQLGDSAGALLETLDRNVNDPSALRLQRFVQQAELPAHSVARFEALAAERSQPMIDGIAAWLDDHGLEAGSAGVDRKRVAVGFYLFVE